jgi:hypothetical protein
MGYVKGHIRRTSRGIKYVGGHLRRPRVMAGMRLRRSRKAAKGCLVVLFVLGAVIVFSTMLAAWVLTAALPGAPVIHA